MAPTALARPLTVIVFVLLSLVPLASLPGDWLWPWPHPHTMPHVRPVPPPQQVSLDMLNEFERWFVDRIRRHLPLLAVNAAYQVGLLRNSTNPLVTIGRDGWLFFTDEGNTPGTMADFRGKLRLTDAQVRTANRQLLAMHDVLAACGIHALVVVAPNKQSIYGEYLSGSDRLARTALDDFMARLDPQARAMILDLRPPLRIARARNPEMPLYFKTDTHWNELGAFYAYRAVIEFLAKMVQVANLSDASLDEFTVQTVPFENGDLATTMLSAPAWFTDTAVEVRRKADVIAPPDAPRLMVIGDSFAGRLFAFVQPHFSGVLGDEFRHAATNLQAGGGKPSVVVIEVVERFLPRLTELNFDWTKLCAP